MKQSRKQGNIDFGSRRVFLVGAAAACAGLAAKAMAQTLSAPKRGPTVTIEDFSPAGKSLGRMQMARVTKTESEWRKQLTTASFEVARREGTEQPYSGKYWNNHAAGVYRCICCDTAAFDAQTKFESGTGWPSFWQPISRANIVETPDNSRGMQRTTVSCSRCDAHLGHVFDDGLSLRGCAIA